MKLLIEEYDYPVEAVAKLFPNFDELDPVDGKVRVSYVGYYYHAAEQESVFILPKVVLEANEGSGPEKVFGRHRPEDIIDLDADGSPLSRTEREFIYGLAVWIYRAIAVYRDDCRRSKRDHTIIRHQNIVRQGRGRKRTANTYLDILLSLIDFGRRNREWFMFIMKNIHSGYNKINWNRTIAKSQVVVQHNEPVYIDPVTKKRRVNFDEELLVIFHSILHYIGSEYGFPVDVNVNYDLITGKRFRQWVDKGLGMRRLRQIKYKYFSDKALELWELCYAFFEQSKQIRIASQMNEYLLAKNFNIVFEAMIDELIGESTLPDRLNRHQEDGKEVDHLFLWDSLTRVRREDEQRQGSNMTYYIGDSKYYKQKNRVGRESVAKQFTYARNVIQWNLNLFFGEKAQQGDRRASDFCLRDEVTEGYNVIPNFFLSGKVPPDFNYRDHIEETQKKASTHISRQYVNRLFDRDTLLVTHYDVNFLFVLALYGRNNAARKRQWREKVRNIFREKIRLELSDRYEFHALRALPNVDLSEWLKVHFRDVIGKVFAPYDEDKGIVALALANPARELDATVAAAVAAENARVLSLVDTAFVRVKLDNIGVDPRPLLPHPAAALAAPPGKDGVVMLADLHYDTDLPKFEASGKVALPVLYNKEGMRLLENIGSIGFMLFHKWNRPSQHLFRLLQKPRVVPRPEIPAEYENIRNRRRPDELPDGVDYLYLLLDLDMGAEVDADSLDCGRRKLPGGDPSRYDALYATLGELTGDGR